MKSRALLLALSLVLPAAADESSPLSWWRLQTHPPELTGDKAVALRSLDAARALLRWQDGIKTLEPAWLERVDFEKWMVVMVPCRGNEGTRWDVIAVTQPGAGGGGHGHPRPAATDERPEPTIALMRELNGDGNTQVAASAIAVLIPKSDLEVLTTWREGKIEDLAKDRDCHCVPDPSWIGARGSCSRCGDEKTTLGIPGICQRCATALQQCFVCGKRVPGPVPLREERK